LSGRIYWRSRYSAGGHRGQRSLARMSVLGPHVRWGFADPVGGRGSDSAADGAAVVGCVPGRRCDRPYPGPAVGSDEAAASDRARQDVTVGRDTPTRSAIEVLLTHSGQQDDLRALRQTRPDGWTTNELTPSTVYDPRIAKKEALLACIIVRTRLPSYLRHAAPKAAHPPGGGSLCPRKGLLIWTPEAQEYHPASHVASHICRICSATISSPSRCSRNASAVSSERCAIKSSSD